jgi:hypothetical protein
MGLDLWFQDDVARILAATKETMRSSLGAVAPLDAEEANAYQQGFADALRSVAVAFGVCPPDLAPWPEERRRSHTVRVVDSAASLPGHNGTGRRR